MNLIILFIFISILAVIMTMTGRGGGKIAIKTKPEYLKKIFAFTTLAAAVFMGVNTFITKQ